MSPPAGGIRFQINEGSYFNVDSPIPSETGSQSPTYPTHHLSKINVKL